MMPLDAVFSLVSEVYDRGQLRDAAARHEAVRVTLVDNALHLSDGEASPLDFPCVLIKRRGPTGRVSIMRAEGIQDGWRQVWLLFT